jgi:hypothetical protein
MSEKCDLPKSKEWTVVSISLDSRSVGSYESMLLIALGRVVRNVQSDYFQD